MTSDKQEKSKKIKSIFGFLLPLLLTAVFLFIAFRKVDVAESFRLLSEISLAYFALYFLFFCLGNYLRALRWKYILDSVKPDTKILNLLGATMVGYGVNCVLPRFGEIYRPAFLGKWENISRSSVFGTIIVERIIDLLALGFSVLISVMIFPGDLYAEFPWLKSTVIIGFAFMIALIVIVVLTVRLKHHFYDIIVKIAGKISHKLADKLAYLFDTLVEGFTSLKGIRNHILTIFLTIAIMCVYAYTSYLGFYVLGMQNIKDISFAMAWIVMSISAFGVVIPTPGSTGSYHAFVMAVLIQILAFNNEISGAYALFTHLVSYFSFILSTLFFVFIINRIREKSGIKKETFISVFHLNKGDN